jgi:hypothetical protein
MPLGWVKGLYRNNLNPTTPFPKDSLTLYAQWERKEVSEALFSAQEIRKKQINYGYNNADSKKTVLRNSYDKNHGVYFNANDNECQQPLEVFGQNFMKLYFDEKDTDGVYTIHLIGQLADYNAAL